MTFQLSDLLKAIGPNAAIIFAAWIFLSFLQTRYDSAVNRYREYVDSYREGRHSEERHGPLKRQIEVSSRRCTLMSRAIGFGLGSAVLFILTLIGGALDVIVPHQPVIGWISSLAAMIGLLLMIVCAAIVIFENAGASNQLKKEVEDIGDVSGRVATKHARLRA